MAQTYLRLRNGRFASKAQIRAEVLTLHETVYEALSRGGVMDYALDSMISRVNRNEFDFAVDTHNMIDSMSVSYYVSGKLRECSVADPVATEPQHWGGPFKGRGWGSDFASPDDFPVWENQDEEDDESEIDFNSRDCIAFVFRSGIPYSVWGCSNFGAGRQAFYETVRDTIGRRLYKSGIMQESDRGALIGAFSKYEII